MSDERIVEVISGVLRRWALPSSMYRAQRLLAALRAEGYDLYRPEDAQRICTCNYTEGIDASGDPSEHNSWCEAISGRQWVPVSEGTEPQ